MVLGRVVAADTAWAGRGELRKLLLGSAVREELPERQGAVTVAGSPSTAAASRGGSLRCAVTPGTTARRTCTPPCAHPGAASCSARLPPL